MDKSISRAIKAVARRPLLLALIALTFVEAVEGRSPAEEPRKSGIDRANFDMSVKPGDDFYNYVNGEWIKKNPIPPEYSRWGAFPKLRDDNLIALHDILGCLLKKTLQLGVKVGVQVFFLLRHTRK